MYACSDQEYVMLSSNTNETIDEAFLSFMEGIL